MLQAKNKNGSWGFLRTVTKHNLRLAWIGCLNMAIIWLYQWHCQLKKSKTQFNSFRALRLSHLIKCFRLPLLLVGEIYSVERPGLEVVVLTVHPLITSGTSFHWDQLVLTCKDLWLHACFFSLHVYIVGKIPLIWMLFMSYFWILFIISIMELDCGIMVILFLSC